jgi:hypothetical protein
MDIADPLGMGGPGRVSPASNPLGEVTPIQIMEQTLKNARDIDVERYAGSDRLSHGRAMVW